MESVIGEIQTKIYERKVSLERSFPSNAYSRSQNVVDRMASMETDIANTRLRIHRSMAEIERRSEQLEDRKSRYELIQQLDLPRASAVAKANVKDSAKVQLELRSRTDHLGFRRMTLLKELSMLYPIDYQGKFRVIRGLTLPGLSGLRRCEIRDEETISTALGYLVHRIYLSCKIVDFNLKFILVPLGSRSVVKDRFSEPSLAEYPLYYKSIDRKKFVTAVQMLHDTLFHFSCSRGKRPDQSTDLLDIADMLLVRELFKSS